MKLNLKLVYGITKIFPAGLLLLTVSCSTDMEHISNQEVLELEGLEPVNEVNNLVSSDFGVYFNRNPNTYWYGHFVNDFGNVSGYSNAEKNRHNITSSNTLRVTLEKNKIGQDGGAICDIDIMNKQEYIFKYKVRFNSGFDWAIGGKIPGLGGGDVYAGGQDTSDGKGWSFRPVWHQYDNVNGGNPFLAPYAYYVDQPNKFGNEFSSRYTIRDNQWYNIWLRVKMNTDTNSDGIIHMKVNNSTVYYDGTFRWVTEDDGREIDEIMWDIFRGGAGVEHESPSDNTIDFDSFVIDAK